MKKNSNILLVDDEPDILELLDITLSRMGHNCITAENVPQAIEQLEKHSFKLCLTDMNLGNGNGLDVIEHIQNNYSDLPVAMITAYENTETAILAMKAGAYDYVAKPIDLPKLRVLVNSALKIESCKIEEENNSTIQLLGTSQAIQSLREKINKLARSLAPVFVHGESGTGKELAARLIHQKGPRSSQPFIAINCGAIPSELMESEFFGHEKGSFTGATEQKIGLFQAADGGTLFLDEIADLPKEMQVKLLRAIQEKAIRPVGANKEVTVDVRIISATHKDLPQEVSLGSFRQDLYYRINVIELNIPALRERTEDILQLSSYFLKKLADRYELPLATLDEESLNSLSNYSFPGNVRELENILERAFTLCESNRIQPGDLTLANYSSPEPSQTTTTSDGINLQDAIGNYDGFIESIEKQILENALEQARWNKTAAAKLLGISFRAFRYKLSKLGID